MPKLKVSRMYQNGSGVTVDMEQAFSWFKRSAEQGIPEAQTFLAAMYEEGRGAIKIIPPPSSGTSARNV